MRAQASVIVIIHILTAWATFLHGASLSNSDTREIGQLQVSALNPYYFSDGQKQIVFVGVSDRDALTLWKNDKGFDWRSYLEDISNHGLNYVRQDVFSWGALTTSLNYPAQFSNPAWPFVRPGPGRAVDKKPRFDLTRFDQSYFDTRLKPFLAEAKRLGICVELTLFEGFRRSNAFAECLYADANNINSLRLTPRQATSDAALGHAGLLSIQEAYVDKVLQETSAFGNVIYEIANETGGKRWVAHFIAHIQNHPRFPSRLVSAGEQTSPFDPRLGANNIVVKHRGGGGLYASHEDVANHHRALLQYRVGKPVLHNEYFLYANRSTDDPDFPRKMMWADFLAGGHSNFYDFAHWRGSGRTLNDGRPSESPPRQILEGGRHLLAFIRQERIPFWSMHPATNLVAFVSEEPTQKSDSIHVFALADLDKEYVFYILGQGPGHLQIELPRKDFLLRWYDPKSGEFLRPSASILGKPSTDIQIAQFNQDIVLHLKLKAAGSLEAE